MAIVFRSLDDVQQNIAIFADGGVCPGTLEPDGFTTNPSLAKKHGV